MVHLSVGWAVLVDVVAWAVIGVVVGYVAHRTPPSRLDHDTRLTRLRRWERSGRVYERFGIRRWKDRVPELGALFVGGVSKRATGGRSRLDRFTVESRRAEYTHWFVMAPAPLFALWNPWPLTAAMVGYAVVANVPCLAIQRYNRARVARLPSQRRLHSPTLAGPQPPPAARTSPPPTNRLVPPTAPDPRL